MKLPWLQMEREVFPKAELLAGLLGNVNDNEAIGILAKLWRLALSQGRSEEPPNGLISAPNASRIVAIAVRWAGPEEELVDALVTAGFIDRMPNGLRIRGVTRYQTHWRRIHNIPSNQDLEPTAQSPRSNGAVSQQQTKTKTKTKTKKETLNVVPIPKASGRSATDGPEVEALQAAWNDNHGNLLGWKLTSAKRAKAARELLRVHGLELATEAIRRSAACPFLTGENDRGWVAGPEFFLRPGKLEEILEGKYDARPAVFRKNGMLDIAHNTATSKEYDDEGLFRPIGEFLQKPPKGGVQ